MFEQLKKWWHVIAIIFAGGIAFGTMRFQVEDLARRMVTVEEITREIPGMKANLDLLVDELVTGRNRKVRQE